METGGAPRQRGSGFRASLTELEVTGTQAVSAESIATGKSAELAGEEVARAAGGGVTISYWRGFSLSTTAKRNLRPALGVIGSGQSRSAAAAWQRKEG